MKGLVRQASHGSYLYASLLSSPTSTAAETLLWRLGELLIAMVRLEVQASNCEALRTWRSNFMEVTHGTWNYGSMADNDGDIATNVPKTGQRPGQRWFGGAALES